LAARIPTSVEQPVASNVVGKIAAGSTESKLDRNPMIPVGSRARPDVLIAKNRAMALVAVPLCGFRLFSSFIAFKPNGVAAFPKPNALAATFITIAPIAG
jgi:hypothetical protein